MHVCLLLFYHQFYLSKQEGKGLCFCFGLSRLIPIKKKYIYIWVCIYIYPCSFLEMLNHEALRIRSKNLFDKRLNVFKKRQGSLAKLQRKVLRPSIFGVTNHHIITSACVFLYIRSWNIIMFCTDLFFFFLGGGLGFQCFDS